jgi:hypothetical protein
VMTMMKPLTATIHQPRKDPPALAQGLPVLMRKNK